MMFSELATEQRFFKDHEGSALYIKTGPTQYVLAMDRSLSYDFAHRATDIPVRLPVD